MSKQSITVVIDFQIYAYLFKPIIAKFIEQNIDVTVYFPSEIKGLVTKELAIFPEVHFADLDKIKRHHKNRWRIHRALQSLLTRDDFSFQYGKKRNQVTLKTKGVAGVLMKLADFTPKVPNLKINAFLHKVVGIGLHNPFPTNKILVGSLNASAELLCARGQQVYTVMESWDHPVKTPNGYSSHRVYAWNQSLAEDWQATQGDHICVPFYPLKLRYAIHEIREKGLWQKSQGQRKRPLCVYAVTSTRKFSYALAVEIENQIINDLCEATKIAGWDLLIKPRPNGMTGEFDEFVKQHNHVKVGSIKTDKISIPANYYLDDEYNQLRFKELLDASLVINAFTTFGLDAAVAGIPVLQLDLRKASGYENSNLLFNNHHIKKYLLDVPSTFVVVEENFREKIIEFLKSPNSVPEVYRDNLCNWLIPKESMDEALKKLVDDVLIGDNFK